MRTTATNEESQKELEREARIASARYHVESSANLAHTLSDEVWDAVLKEVAEDDNLT